MDSSTEPLTSESEARCQSPRLRNATRQDVQKPKSPQLRDPKIKTKINIEEDGDKMKREGQQNRQGQDGIYHGIHDKNGNQDSDLQVLTAYGIWIDGKLQRGMDLEKRLYPGASTWAGDEERLYEMLYLRQELPILPSFWEIDFRGIPISERCFSTTDTAKPIVYAHCREFRATMALTKLIDLTANVRTAIQCGLPHKAPPLIKKALDAYIAWAAQDGSFAHLDVVPNIIAETVDASHGEAGVTRTIENRMRALARLQREYLKTDRDEDLRLGFETKGGKGWTSRLIDRFFKLFETRHGPVEEEEEARDLQMEGSGGGIIIKGEPDDDAPMGNIPLAPRSADEESHSEFRRRPPVVYGLFIVNTSIFLMTVDSARGDGGYVTFHVDLDLKDYKQSVWNALTMAMVVCVARDEMMSRLEDFEEARPVAEVDLDV